MFRELFDVLCVLIEEGNPTNRGKMNRTIFSSNRFLKTGCSYIKYIIQSYIIKIYNKKLTNKLKPVVTALVFDTETGIKA